MFCCYLFLSQPGNLLLHPLLLLLSLLHLHERPVSLLLTGQLLALLPLSGSPLCRQLKGLYSCGGMNTFRQY